MNSKIKRIGICGGTFDPIHNGHLIITENIRQDFELDKVLFIPSNKPPHKNFKKITEAAHRCNMVELAIEKNKYFEISTIEMNRAGFTFTVDTIKELKNKYEDNVELFFICGADVVFDLLNWKDPQEVFKITKFIAAYRTEYEVDSLHKQVKLLNKNYNANINLANTLYVEISSTMIRNRVANNKSIKYLVPDSVEKYIFENNLYYNIENT